MCRSLLKIKKKIHERFWKIEKIHIVSEKLTNSFETKKARLVNYLSDKFIFTDLLIIFWNYDDAK